MARWVQAGILLVAAAVVVLGIAVWMGQRRWQQASAAMAARLDAATGTAAQPALDPAHDDLPPPVSRYFAFALSPGQAPVRRARLVQEGEFFLQPGASGSRFTAVDRVTAAPPGLIWEATIRLAPLVAVRVRDSYLEGVGSMQAALAALVPLAHESGCPEIATAALQRFLAEAPWVPTLLLPSPALRWTAINDTSARATLTDRGISAVVVFHFGPDGRITGISAERYRSAGGAQLLTPWVGEFSQYERVAGMMIPRRGEIAWELPQGRFTYWRGRIVAVKYERFP